MFKQFIQNFTESQAYLLFSLWLFFVFFILVGVMLFLMKRPYVNYMRNLPLDEEETE